MTCPDISEIASYFCEQAHPVAAETIAIHLRTCQKCRALYDEMDACTSSLSEDEEAFNNVDLAPSIMAFIRKEEAAKGVDSSHTGWRLNWRRWIAQQRSWKNIYVAALTALVLVGSIVYLHRNGTGLDEEFQARSISSSKPESQASLSVFRRKGQTYTLVDRNIYAKDYLAFSYMNDIDSPSKFLMIFAVDQNNEVFWYYPAYTNSNRNPCSIPIEATALKVRLPDEIRHSFNTGPVRIWALFSEESICVKQVEEFFQHRSQRGSVRLNMEKLPFPKTIQQSVLINVNDSSAQDDK